MGLPYASVSPASDMREAAESTDSHCEMERRPWSWGVSVREASWCNTWSCRIGCLVHGLPLVSMSPFSRGFRVCHQILHKWPRNEGRMSCQESHRETWGDRGAQPGMGTDNFEPHSSGESLGIWPPLPAGKVGLSMCPEEKRSKLSEHSVFVTWSKGTGKDKMSSVWLIQILVTFLECRWLLLVSWRNVGSLDHYRKKLAFLDRPVSFTGWVLWSL